MVFLAPTGTLNTQDGPTSAVDPESMQKLATHLRIPLRPANDKADRCFHDPSTPDCELHRGRTVIAVDEVTFKDETTAFVRVSIRVLHAREGYLGWQSVRGSGLLVEKQDGQWQVTEELITIVS